MLNIKEAPAEARGQRQNPSILYHCPIVKASGNLNSHRLPVRELLAQEIAHILIYLQNPFLDEQEKSLGWRLFESSLTKLETIKSGKESKYVCKKITWGHYEKYNELPIWFNELGDFIKPIPVLHFSKFYYYDEKLNLKLTGIPDDIFLCKDGSYFIIDYKTAKYTKNQDKLLPLYITQLNGYALIFEKMGLGKISGIGLCYYEPMTNIDDIDKVTIEDGFKMAFSAHIMKLELDPMGIMPLMNKVREIGDMKKMPMGKEGCLDCEKIEGMIKLIL